MTKIQGPKEGKTNSNIYKEEWIQQKSKGNEVNQWPWIKRGIQGSSESVFT